MDKTVIVLIGAGVCCVVIGLALFVKLLTTKQDESEDTNGNKKLLDNEYAENFKECFEDTGDIEDTLDQLATIYTGNQYMYNLIVNALDFIRDEQGDYETALDEINVDNDPEIANMHNAAIKKALNLEGKNAIARKPKEEKGPKEIKIANKNEESYITDNFDEDDDCESEKDDTIGSEHQNDKAVGMIPTETEVIADDFKEFDEDDEDDEEDEIITETQKKEAVSITKPEKIEEKEKPKKVTKKRPAKKPVILDEEDDEEEDDDIDGFKIG